MVSSYEVVYDSRPYGDSTETMVQKLNRAEEFCNDKLKHRGHLSLNDVIAGVLGLPRTLQGDRAGWKWDGLGDPPISFNITILDDGRAQLRFELSDYPLDRT